MICIYHNKDLDGYCSAAIIKKRYPDAIMIGHDYPMKFDMNRIPEGEPVIMVDVLLPMWQMFELAEKTNYQLIWVDHHITAINDYKAEIKKMNFEDGFLALIADPAISACELAWGYFFPEEPLPTAIKLLGKYDTWRNQDPIEWEQAILPFQYGMRQICNSAETFPAYVLEFFDIVTDSPVYTIIRDGKNILQYQKAANEKACKNSFRSSFEGYSAIMLNAMFINSLAFESVFDSEIHDIVMPFFYNGSKWVFSIYTTKPGIDCGAMAKKYGGGGHTKAAGFDLSDFNEVLKIINPAQYAVKNI